MVYVLAGGGCAVGGGLVERRKTFPCWSSGLSRPGPEKFRCTGKNVSVEVVLRVHISRCSDETSFIYPTLPLSVKQFYVKWFTGRLT